MSKKKLKITVVEWEDAASTTGWVRKDSNQPWGLMNNVSCGLLVKETKKHLTLAGSFTELGGSNEAYCGLMTVPKAWVKKRYEVKV